MQMLDDVDDVIPSSRKRRDERRRAQLGIVEREREGNTEA